MCLLEQTPAFVRKAKLPSPPPVISNFLDLMDNPESEVEDLIAVVQGDASITAKVLRFANSAASSPVSDIDSLKNAVLRIGMLPVINMVTASEMARIFFSVPLPHGDIYNLWTHNMLVGCIANTYAAHYKIDSPGRWFTAGLLHDIGRLLLICHDPIKYAETIEYSAKNGATSCDSEEIIMGMSHSDAGGLLLRWWGLPVEIVKAASGHHLPFNRIDDIASGIGICNRIANDLLLSEPLYAENYSGVQLDMIINDAVEMFEAIKKASGITMNKNN